MEALIENAFLASSINRKEEYSMPILPKKETSKSKFYNLDDADFRGIMGKHKLHSYHVVTSTGIDLLTLHCHSLKGEKLTCPHSYCGTF